MATNGCDKACGSLFCATNCTDYLMIFLANYAAVR
ncbi:hypothetical protein T4A_10096 [Trichinella pseudospiralis]|uniref:Uncharacterized protein n=1 Tax=Trichinella pseudospiralis TaxID=6337 RepID=A0A0V1D6Q0_TRIPS|nr:hypothetical protein T4A_10096 [Trichinella pseudospiralis]